MANTEKTDVIWELRILEKYVFLPNMSDSKELMLVGTAENSEEYYEAQKKLSEELIYLLSEASFGYFSESNS